MPARHETGDYLGSALLYEIVPKNMHEKAPRKFMGQGQWDKVRDFARKRAEGRCEICGASKGMFDTHERYGILGNALVVLRIMHVCKRCHLSIHPGFANIIGKFDDALSRYAKINGLSLAQSEEDCDQAFMLFAGRDDIVRLDWSIFAGKPYSEILTPDTIGRASASCIVWNGIMAPLAYIPGWAKGRVGNVSLFSDTGQKRGTLASGSRRQTGQTGNIQGRKNLASPGSRCHCGKQQAYSSP